jgi:hypothetical protein
MEQSQAKNLRTRKQHKVVKNKRAIHEAKSLETTRRV